MANSFNGNNFHVDSDGLLYTGRVRVIGVHVVGGTAITRLKLHDGLDGTGRLVFDSGEVPINQSEAYPRFIECRVGLYADITTTGGYADVDIA